MHADASWGCCYAFAVRPGCCLLLAAVSKARILRDARHSFCLPVHVQVVRGNFKSRDGKVTAVYRKKWVIQIERINKEKNNGATVPVGLDPSKVIITKLHLDPGMLFFQPTLCCSDLSVGGLVRTVALRLHTGTVIHEHVLISPVCS